LHRARHGGGLAFISVPKELIEEKRVPAARLTKR
jgi:hypothetical protein